MRLGIGIADVVYVWVLSRLSLSLSTLGSDVLCFLELGF